MPKSRHQIDLDRKARGVPPHNKCRRMTLVETRAKIRLPFTPEHITEEEIKEGIRRLQSA